MEELAAWGPSSLTILPTYRCTAACQECCFECHPKLDSPQISIDRIVNYIDQAATSFPDSLKLVVFSGGECFLLGDDLVTAVSRAHAHNLLVRCVSNGYWGTSRHAARKRIRPLAEAGLTELNISTGDDHQKYVPFERVVNAAIEAALADVEVLIVIEGHESSHFKLDNLLHHERLMDFVRNDPKGKHILWMNNIWIPFHADREIQPFAEAVRSEDHVNELSGCDNVILNPVITPHQQFSSCCGLTMEHIPEMKMGRLSSTNFADLYRKQFQDFMKIWINVEGPERIMKFAVDHDESLTFPGGNTHPCETCAQVYRNPRIQDVLRKHWHEVEDRVLFQFALKQELQQLPKIPMAGSY